MTAPIHPTARDPLGANNPGGEGAVVNGRVLMWNEGVFAPVDPSIAWGEWLSLQSSHLPESQARARTLRNALDQIGYLQ